MGIVIILRGVIPALWLAWLAFWLVRAIGNKRAEWRESPLMRLSYGVPALLGSLLIFTPRLWPDFLDRHFLPRSLALAAIGAALLALGLGFSIWARQSLGRNWSAAVEIKEDHSLIRSGPYRFVRHPIYSGALLGLFGTALAVGEWRAALGFVLLLIAFLLKAEFEEERLAVAFPDYATYRREIAALIPYLF